MFYDQKSHIKTDKISHFTSKVFNSHSYSSLFHNTAENSHWTTDPNFWYYQPLGPWLPLVPSSELSEHFRPDSISTIPTVLGGVLFPDSSGKKKDKWRIIDSRLLAKGISMTEYLGSLPFSLPPSLSISFYPHPSAQLVCRSVSTLHHQRTALSINTPNRKGKTY